MNGFLVDAFTNPEEAPQNLQSNSKDYYSLTVHLEVSVFEPV
jgi:hypothetical protein